MRVGDISTLAGVYSEVEKAAWEAKTRTIAAEVMGPRTAAQFTSHEAWGAVATHLRTAETQGLDPAVMLAQAAGITQYDKRHASGQNAPDTGHLHGFAGAADPAAVLAYRLEQRIDTAHTLLSNTDQRPLGAVSDEHLQRLAQQATRLAAGTELPCRTPGEAPMDTQWAARPFALMRTDKLSEAQSAAVQRVRSFDSAVPADADARKAQWTAQAMTIELERRENLSPTQTAIERTARGEDPRSAHQITIAEAIKHEQQLRAGARPNSETTGTPGAVPDAPVAPVTTPAVSEDLAPASLLQDPLVPASYRSELERLRTHIGQRVMVRGAQLAEEQPAWTKALGPVPGKEAKAAQWYQIAAETEAYRNRYNIGSHETALVPKQYQDDPPAQHLIQRATAMHKHGELTKTPHQTTAQVQQAADEAAIVDRMTNDRAAVRRVIDRLRAERAAAGDPLPTPQQREARIVEAAQSTAQQAPTSADQAKAPDSMDDVVARATAKHRAATEKARGEAAANGSTTPDPAQGPQNQNTKESAMNENKDATRSQNRPSWWGNKTAEAVRRKQATPEKPVSKAAQEEAASAARRAAEAPDRNRGRSR